MSLKDLNRELDNPNDPELAHHVHEKSNYDPWVVNSKLDFEKSPFEEEKWGEVKKGLTLEQKRKIKIGIETLLGVFFLVSLVLGFQWWQKNSFRQDRVAIYFEGPREVDNTGITKYIIHYNNANQVSLKNVEIYLKYPENFQPTNNVNLKILSPTTSKIAIPDIKARSEKSVELNGVFYAPKNYPVQIEAKIIYTPSNKQEQLFNDTKIGVTVTKTPIVLDIAAPQNASSGDAVEYVIDYKSLDVRLMSDMQVRIDFPAGFEYIASQPLPSEKNSYWYVGNLEPNQGGQIRIQGKLSGIQGDTKTIAVLLGRVDQDGQFSLYNKRETTTKMNAPMLSINQKIRDHADFIVNSGEELNYVVSFRNNGNIGLRNAIVTAQIDGNILDLSKLKIEKGSFDSNTGLITWKASEVPVLANIDAGQGGEVYFSVPVKQVIPVSTPNDKNFEITTVAKIDSPDIPTPIDSNKIIDSNTLKLRLASKIIFDTKGFYTDKDITNSGPIPLQVGKETTFTMHWSITNVSNDLTKIKVISSLPSGVQWKGMIKPEGEKISFNQRTNQIIWEVGDIPSGTGIINSTRSIAFQIGITPQSNNAGESMIILNEAILTGNDIFISKDVSVRTDKKNTELPEDPGVGYVGGKVEAIKN
jgi:uncharacterized repeat protein (TIGR01451 family)